MQEVLTEEQALKNLSANLAASLAARKWPQVELARKIMQRGETIEAASMRVSRYLRQECVPSAAVLANMAEALGVTADWLLSAPSKKSRQAG